MDVVDFQFYCLERAENDPKTAEATQKAVQAISNLLAKNGLSIEANVAAMIYLIDSAHRHVERNAIRLQKAILA